jgi:hypothetical protein
MRMTHDLLLLTRPAPRRHTGPTGMETPVDTSFPKLVSQIRLNFRLKRLVFVAYNVAVFILLFAYFHVYKVRYILEI